MLFNFRLLSPLQSLFPPFIVLLGRKFGLSLKFNSFFELFSHSRFPDWFTDFMGNKPLQHLLTPALLFICRVSCSNFRSRLGTQIVLILPPTPPTPTNFIHSLIHLVIPSTQLCYQLGRHHTFTASCFITFVTFVVLFILSMLLCCCYLCFFFCCMRRKSASFPFILNTFLWICAKF